jgi:hypothetical protein
VSVSLKLLLTCNLKPDIEKAKVALAYVTQEFPEKMQNAGLDLEDIWYTVFGTWPQIRMSFLTQDPESLRTFLHSEKWEMLRGELQQKIHNYTEKVIVSRHRFQF